MTESHSLILFLDVLEHSPLDDSEKAELKDSAEANGVSQELWARFNDRMISSLVRNRGRYSRWRSRLDSEVARYTAEYESEKSVIDRKMMDDLAAVESEEDKERLWQEYGKRIGVLQKKLLAEVRDTSQTILKDAFRVMVGGF